MLAFSCFSCAAVAVMTFITTVKDADRVCQELLELGPYNSVVRCFFRLTGLEIHVGNLAAVRQRCSRKNVIDAPAKVALKCVSKVIPIGVLHTITMELSKDIGEPPTHCLLVGGSSIDVEIHVVYSPLGGIDGDWLGGDVLIPKPAPLLLGLELLFKIAAKASKPGAP